MTDIEYERRAAATLAKRLLQRLVDRDVLSDSDLYDLVYPPVEAIEEAEAL